MMFILKNQTCTLFLHVAPTAHLGHHIHKKKKREKQQLGHIYSKTEQDVRIIVRIQQQLLPEDDT